MKKLDLFIEKNYDLIKKHFYHQAREMGCSTRQYKSYFEDCKCFVFVGTTKELKKEINSEHDYYIIAQENDLVIAEMFNGLMYNFI